MVKNKYSFQLSDNFAPKQVIENELKKISEETHGYVQGEISDYRGPIRSYKKSSRGSFTTLLTKPSNTSNTVDVDIQEDLGELSFDRYRYEVYLRVKRAR
ncbi:Uncharacterised protein [Scardovia inopinata]|uniref:Uncharacterized protein n=1 Tax=Scardovia inopinata F0304 TaxID=641146 RepID=W1MXG9_SCAIO|nr:hypothetical protein [Scardovia inopinata]EQW18113.1 hypothetical protein HMPREF9020_01483 [Scardovia inopinata F0304]BAR06160.1 hypothetical protein SCIP_0093 [Scardovia inopinata JCM 12537]SUV51679.1 Uncharacterised protein [Scardovia inopinata]